MLSNDIFSHNINKTSTTIVLVRHLS